MNVYVDTGGWVAYFDQSDRFPSTRHILPASHLAPGSGSSGDERLCARRNGILFAVSRLTCDSAHGLSDAECFGADASHDHVGGQQGEIRTRAGHIFEQFHDQTFSFTDCTSFALCEAHHIQHAVTVDKDFVIFGLVILPEALARFVLSPSQH